jgi:hypothetical protein
MMGMCGKFGRSGRVLDIAFLACLSVATLYAIARLSFMPLDPNSGVAVIFAPWIEPQDALTRAVGAGGRFLRFGGFSFITVIVPDDPDYGSRVLAAGAWFVVDPNVLAACLPNVATAAR